MILSSSRCWWRRRCSVPATNQFTNRSYSHRFTGGKHQSINQFNIFQWIGVFKDSFSRKLSTRNLRRVETSASTVWVITWCSTVRTPGTRRRSTRTRISLRWKPPCLTKTGNFRGNVITVLNTKKDPNLEFFPFMFFIFYFDALKK